MGIAAVALVMSLSMFEQPAAPAGSWRAEWIGPGGTKGVETLTLTVNGDVVTGTFVNALGHRIELKEGKWDGTKIRFWVPWDRDDRLRAEGTLGNGKLTMTLSSSKWRDKRIFERLLPVGR